MAWTDNTVRVQVACGMVLVDCIPPHKQGLDNGIHWLLQTLGSTDQSLGNLDPNVGL